jgi:hypothetical protein
MFRTTLGAIVALILLASPGLAGGEKTPRPQLTAQVLDGMQAVQENLIRLRVKALRVHSPRPVGSKTGVGRPRG